MGAEWDGIGRDGTGSDGTGRDGIGLASYQLGRASNRNFCGRLCQRVVIGRGDAVSAELRAELIGHRLRPWKKDGVSRSDSAPVDQYRSTPQLLSSLFEVRQHAQRFSRQRRCLVRRSRAQRREHNLQAETLSTPSTSAWRVSCGGGSPKSSNVPMYPLEAASS